MCTCGVRAPSPYLPYTCRAQVWVLPRLWEESTPPTTQPCSATLWSLLKVCSRRAWHGCTSLHTRWATACSLVPSTRSATSSRRSRAAPPPKRPWAATALTVAIRQPPPPPPPCARFASVASSCFTLRQISTGARLWLRLAASSVPTCTYHCSQAKFAPRPHRYGFLRPLRAAGL